MFLTVLVGNETVPIALEICKIEGAAHWPYRVRVAKDCGYRRREFAGATARYWGDIPFFSGRADPDQKPTFVTRLAVLGR
jgi:hypothetical protein